MKEVTDDNPSVLDDPAPSIIYWQFRDKLRELTARLFIGSMDELWQVTTIVHHAIYKRITEDDIPISIPQIDVHFDSAQLI